MRLTERDLLILKLLNKLRVLDIDTIMLLCGFTDYVYTTRRMAVLYKNGYVDCFQKAVSTKKYYYLKQKGMNVLFPPVEVTTKKKTTYIKYKEPANFTERNVNHEIQVANVLHYLLKCNPDLTVDDFKTDRDIQCSMTPKERRKGSHTCDLLCEKYRVKVEVELTKKDKKRIQNNVSSNGNTYSQVWITGNTPVHNLLLAIQKKFVYFTMDIIRLDELENNPIVFSELYDKLLKNNPRVKDTRKAQKKKDESNGQMTIDEFI